MMFPDTPQPREVLSVSQLNRTVRKLIEQQVSRLWVQGEVSNLATPGSGHIYFTLKDAQAEVRCAFFKNKNRVCRMRPENGMEVMVRAEATLYEERGAFQLVVESLEQTGEGGLLRAFEMLKERLAKEGLFDPEQKKPLPAYAKQIGLITSPTGAAIQDVLSVLARRYPMARVIIYPTAVQGKGVEVEIARALALADQRNECDVLLLVRGGGSLEDLWAFNEERLARAIYACQLPIVTGIGHDIDFTIADFVADRHAPTPSAAAEVASPEQSEMLRTFIAHQNRLQTLLQNRLLGGRNQVQSLLRRLPAPTRLIWEFRQQCDERMQRFESALRGLLGQRREHLSTLRLSLQAKNPLYRLHSQRERTAQLAHRLSLLMRQAVAGHRQQLTQLSRALQTISPLATLERGYAIVSRQDDGHIVRAADEVKPGDTLLSRLAKGEIRSKVEKD